MTAHELAESLRRMTPVIETVAGCTLRIHHDSDRDADRVARLVADHYRGDRRSAERDLNRWFVIANFLDEIGATDHAPATLLAIAEAAAAMLRDVVGPACVVEIVGKDGVEHEPLELCVTFYRA